jgi:Fe-Mn family superoxide dismutase
MKMKTRILLFTSALLLSIASFGQFTLPKLAYKYNGLEPYIDSTTMYIHYNNHHAAYANNLNKALEKHPELYKKSIEELLQTLNALPEEIRTTVKNSGGGYYNHNFFWSVMSPSGKNPISVNFEGVIKANFGSLDEFKSQFEKAALSRFGSGWVWLIKDSEGKLKIVSTPNQDNTIMQSAEIKGKPLLTLDVWEHAYYLKYQSKRAAYAQAFWNIVNWTEVERNYGE